MSKIDTKTIRWEFNSYDVCEFSKHHKMGKTLIDLCDAYDAQQEEIKDFQNALNERDHLINSFAAKVDYYESTVFTEGLRLVRDYNDETSTVKEPDVYKVADILKLNKLMADKINQLEKALEDSK